MASLVKYSNVHLPLLDDSSWECPILVIFGLETPRVKTMTNNFLEHLKAVTFDFINIIFWNAVLISTDKRRIMADQVPQEHLWNAGISVVRGQHHHCSGITASFICLATAVCPKSSSLNSGFLERVSRDRSLFIHNRTIKRRVFVILQMVLPLVPLITNRQNKRKR